MQTTRSSRIATATWQHANVLRQSMAADNQSQPVMTPPGRCVYQARQLPPLLQLHAAPLPRPRSCHHRRLKVARQLVTAFVCANQSLPLFLPMASQQAVPPPPPRHTAFVTWSLPTPRLRPMQPPPSFRAPTLLHTVVDNQWLALAWVLLNRCTSRRIVASPPQLSGRLPPMWIRPELRRPRPPRARPANRLTQQTPGWHANQWLPATSPVWQVRCHQAYQPALP